MILAQSGKLRNSCYNGGVLSQTGFEQMGELE